MPRRFALLLIGVNLVFIAATILALFWVRHALVPVETTEMERNLTEALAPTTTTSELQNKRAGFVKIIVGENQALHGTLSFVHVISCFAIFGAGMNIAFVLFGMRQENKRC